MKKRLKNNPNRRRHFAVSLVFITIVATLFYIYESRLDLPTEIVPEAMYDSIFFGGVPAASGFSYDILQLTNRGFEVGYCEEYKNPVWVAYRLFPRPNSNDYPRPSRFEVDNRTRSRVEHIDYTHSGYDRGHMAPNYAISTRFGRDAQLQTFLMSNISPQRPQLNRQLWRRLEQEIANEYANELSEIWIITGPVLDENRERLESGVDIPDAFYKIVVDREENTETFRILAFLVPQDVDGNEPLENFLVSVDSIESLTHLDFLSTLDDSIEDVLESAVSTSLW